VDIECFNLLRYNPKGPRSGKAHVRFYGALLYVQAVAMHHSYPVSADARGTVAFFAALGTVLIVIPGSRVAQWIVRASLVISVLFLPLLALGCLYSGLAFEQVAGTLWTIGVAFYLYDGLHSAPGSDRKNEN
jgi:peptidoglycan/LPS O-acetylase OafA/YrhL